MSSYRSAGCGLLFVLFGIPFAAAGLYMTGLMYSQILQWVSVQSWVETPATLLEVNIEQSGESLGTEATYEYAWQGQKHTGDTVSLHPGRDNVGDFQQQVAAELTDHHERGRPFRCFVNPDNPTQAILYRELRWQILSFLAIFGTVFTTVGCSIVIASLLSISEARKTSRLKELFPGQPWRWKQEWSEGCVRGKGSSRWTALIAGWWVLATLPGGIGATNALFHGNGYGLFGLVLPGIALLIVRASVRGAAKRSRFGESRIELDRFPMITGGVNSGRLLIQNDVAPPTFWKFRLACDVTRGSGEDSHTTTVFDAAVAHEGSEPGGEWGRTAVPFEFRLPANARQSDMEGSKVAWTLTVTGTVGDAEYEDEFLMPVFETEDSDPGFMESSESQPDSRYARDGDAELLRNGLLIREAVDGSLTVIAPARRNRPMKIALGIFCLFWDGLCFVILVQRAPLLFRIAFPACGAAITLVWIDLLMRSSRFQVDSHKFAWRNGWPLVSREKRVPVSDIRKVEAVTSVTSGNSQFYKIRICLESGENATVLSLIQGKAAADTLVSRIQKVLART